MLYVLGTHNGGQVYTVTHCHLYLIYSLLSLAQTRMVQLLKSVGSLGLPQQQLAYFRPGHLFGSVEGLWPWSAMDLELLLTPNAGSRIIYLAPLQDGFLTFTHR